MKTITLDYETYQAELEAEFIRGQGAKAVTEAKQLFFDVLKPGAEYRTDLREGIRTWILKYGSHE